MTDRSLIKDQLEHARRSNPLADTDRIAQIRSLHAARILPCTHEERGMLLTEIDRLTAERDGHQSGREQLRAISREHRAERDRYRLAWQSARQRAQADAEQLAFIHAVLQLALTGDFSSELLWRSDGERITVAVDVSDVFAWGGADAEGLTPERLPVLAEAMADLRAIHPHDDMYTVDLYAARIRQMRPQGAAYPKERAATQALFDACGPERPTGLGNPRKAPAPTEDGQP